MSKDWITVPLGRVVTLQRGFDLPNRLRRPGSVPIITSSGMGDTHNEAMVRGPGVVTGRYGTIGEVFYIERDFWPLNTTLFVRDFHGNDPLFISYLLRTIDFQTHSGKSGVPGVNRNDLHEEVISLPSSLPEQQAIAEALSDVDGLISAVDALIAKKRAIKQGAMQELLTGQRRLPGFAGEWAVKKFPIVCWFQEGPGVRNTQFTRFGVKLLNGTNIFKGELFLESTDRFISELEAYGPYSHFLVDVGDIVIACSGITIDKFDEKVSFIKKEHLPLCMNTSTMRFKPFVEKLIPEYLYHFLMGNSFKEQIGSQATGSAQLNFGPSHVKNVDIALPPLAEQTAIAQILADMDAEIAALAQKREKTVALKQGMMQTLLTGQVRLG